jgi:hypothetical protein
MSPLRLPRWTALVVLPLLAGALLLMHGLDAGATTDGVHGASVAAPAHAHRGEAPSEHHDTGCEGCAVGHLMAACAAVLATGVGLHLARRATRARESRLAASAAGGTQADRQVLRPPEPTWVRLSVMRC